ncbi:hypothetical protein BJ742DRAFT_822020 [Cladochytrium replicatum]|nr:hypothetical protein BJ742DRAFT_822020 [Cladochytrium replicatum]
MAVPRSGAVYGVTSGGPTAGGRPWTGVVVVVVVVVARGDVAADVGAEVVTLDELAVFAVLDDRYCRRGGSPEGGRDSTNTGRGSCWTGTGSTLSVVRVDCRTVASRIAAGRVSSETTALNAHGLAALGHSRVAGGDNERERSDQSCLHDDPFRLSWACRSSALGSVHSPTSAGFPQSFRTPFQFLDHW